MVISLSANAQNFDKASYYKVMEEGKVTNIDHHIKMIAEQTVINKDAYTGALLMKKAGLIEGALNKLNLFKEGHKKLEIAIQTERDNLEFRFLRLMIQEHAPKILGYRAEIDEDAKMVHDSFESFSPEVKLAIADYRKRSEALKKLAL